MPILTVRNVHLAYEDRRLLRGVDLSIEEGERIGLLGQNGIGKSTLLAILAGSQKPDEGERIVRRDLRIGYLEQDPPLDPTLTVRSAVRSGQTERATILADLDLIHTELSSPSLTEERMTSLLAKQAQREAALERWGGHDVDHQVESVISHLGLRDPEARCGVLSGGERRRVALARLLTSAPDLLLLDEPTNHLDAIVTEWLEDWLLDSALPVMMVTHDRYFLDRVTSRILELDRGKIYSYDGNYSDYLVARAERDEVDRHLDQVRRNTLRRETAWIRRGPPAQRRKSKARLGQYSVLVDSKPESAGGELEFRIPSGPRLGTKVIELASVKKSYGNRVIVPPLTLEIGGKDRIGIVGQNGAGKSTLLKLCMGLLAPDSGTVTIGDTVKFAAIDQQRTELDPTKTVIQEVAGRNDWVFVEGRSIRVETFLEQFLFPGDRKHQLIGKLSGGERHRILLAKLLSKGGNVLVLDEPTNDLDIATLRVLEDAVAAFEGAALIVSHDRWFLDRVATRILHFDGQGGLRLHEGSLSLLFDRLDRERLASTPAERATEKAASKRNSAPSPPNKLNHKEQKELTAIPDRIHAAEAALVEIDRRLSAPALFAPPRAAQESAAGERVKAQALVHSLYARWEELESRSR